MLHDFPHLDRLEASKLLRHIQGLLQSDLPSCRLKLEKSKPLRIQMEISLSMEVVMGPASMNG